MNQNLQERLIMAKNKNNAKKPDDQPGPQFIAKSKSLCGLIQERQGVVDEKAKAVKDYNGKIANMDKAITKLAKDVLEGADQTEMDL